MCKVRDLDCDGLYFVGDEDGIEQIRLELLEAGIPLHQSQDFNSFLVDDDGDFLYAVYGIEGIEPLLDREAVKLI